MAWRLEFSMRCWRLNPGRLELCLAQREEELGTQEHAEGSQGAAPHLSLWLQIGWTKPGDYETSQPMVGLSCRCTCHVKSISTRSRPSEQAYWESLIQEK